MYISRITAHLYWSCLSNVNFIVRASRQRIQGHTEAAAEFNASCRVPQILHAFCVSARTRMEDDEYYDIDSILAEQIVREQH